MSTIRVEKNKENPYVMLNKTALDDENLSFKAKGIFAYLMSKPNNWKCQVTDLRKKSKDGADSIKAGLRELRENGYMIKRPVKNERNIIIEWEEILFETPQDVAKEVFQEQEVKRIASLEKRRAKSNNSTNGKSISGKSSSGKPVFIINTDITNNNLKNNNTCSSSKESQGIYNFFETNICELRKTTMPKFKELVEKYGIDFLKAIIEECTLTNVKSFKGFNVAVSNYVNAKCNTPEEVHQYAKDYSKNKKKSSRSSRKTKGENEVFDKLNKRHSTNKQLKFDNFDGRGYTEEDYRFVEAKFGSADIASIDRDKLNILRNEYDEYIKADNIEFNWENNEYNGIKGEQRVITPNKDKQANTEEIKEECENPVYLDMLKAIAK